MTQPPAPDRLTGAAFTGEIRRGLARLFREHTTLAISLTYVFVTTLGAIYEFVMLARFRVNVFQWADPADFLLAAVRQPLALVSVLLPLAVLLLIDALDRGMRRWIPGYAAYAERSRQRQGMSGARGRAIARGTYALVLVLYFTAGILNFASWVGQGLRKGGGRTVRVALLGNGVRDSSVVRGTLLGTTSRVAFVYEPADSTTHVIPLESITEILPERRGRGR